MRKESIIKKVGKKPGKTLAVFAGIHGNERVGVVALKAILKKIEIESGTVYFVFANPPAIKAQKRLINKNLNRLFSRRNKGDTYEDTRAKELMDILDTCDALLDIHSYNSKSGNQFAITEENGFELLKKMDFPIVASGFSGLGNGTDGYMYKQGKVGVCIECGTTNKYKNFLDLAEQSVYQFLQYYKCIPKTVSYTKTKQKNLRVKKIIYKKTENFRFVKTYKDFELLEDGKPFIVDGKKKYIAKSNECIIFPRSRVDIGGEVCIIGEFV